MQKVPVQAGIENVQFAPLQLPSCAQRRFVAPFPWSLWFRGSNPLNVAGIVTVWVRTSGS
jgi:hypothetical protein